MTIPVIGGKTTAEDESIISGLNTEDQLNESPFQRLIGKALFYTCTRINVQLIFACC